jgi:hypothetical protein
MAVVSHLLRRGAVHCWRRKAEFTQRLDQLRTKADLDHVIDSFLEKTRAGAIPEPTAFLADVRLPDG